MIDKKDISDRFYRSQHTLNDILLQKAKNNTKHQLENSKTKKSSITFQFSTMMGAWVQDKIFARKKQKWLTKSPTKYFAYLHGLVLGIRKKQESSASLTIKLSHKKTRYQPKYLSSGWKCQGRPGLCKKKHTEARFESKNHKIMFKHHNTFGQTRKSCSRKRIFGPTR